MTDETKVPSAAGVAVQVPPEAAFWQALGSAIVPKVYANTFSIVVHPTDLALMFGQAGFPTAVVSLNYAVAKTLAGRLADAISKYERAIGNEVPNAEILEQRVRENKPPQS
jgi:hypothetical protein